MPCPCGRRYRLLDPATPHIAHDRQARRPGETSVGGGVLGVIREGATDGRGTEQGAGVEEAPGLDDALAASRSKI